MHSVGILTEHFVKWGGGVDFIRLIIKGLSTLNTEENTKKVKLYILIPKRLKFKTKFKNIVKIALNNCFNSKFVIQKEIDIPQIIKAFKEVDPNIVICHYNDLDKDLKEQVIKNKIDFIIPAFAPLPNNFPIPWVGYLYDFQHKYYPQFFPAAELTSRDKEFAAMLNTAQTVIVNAKAVKIDIKHFIGKTIAKVVSLPFCPVLNPAFFELNVNLAKYNLPKNYFVISNQFWRHKDHFTAIKGFKLFLDGLENKNIGLVCTGQTHDSRFPNYFDEIKDLINEFGLAEKIFILGYIPKNDQLQILKNSVAVIQPTLFEGGPGGGAVYESVAFGIPSIVSDIPVNKELDDETVTFFKTGSPEDLAEKMKMVFESPKKQYSPQELIAKNNKSLVKLGTEILNIFNDNKIVN
ncbi:glycosyltransferase [Flavobacterium sp.]|jgi:glycosyltransferase involved in cell wall biosynthesis|uniref:glycosyltransferase n=1 Tax=Flavobacterium sp. TaxID=239 RepID=UPI0037C071F1